ncbi:reticulocalbin-2 isoform X2 [Hyposmocoma kahamanoa]|uniref:reticulocalbin-2 isoform X2 n=1 Tax=Hyposmocoma kahamanoa TaxID=1477025 RepID=UPI000E6D862A|nr:reticulocalbin-2 isoform X2 [Hyposmocoma kahamanoa]
MASQYWFSLMLLVSHELLHCASAAVHQHSVDTTERESDGSFRARDAGHYDDEARHNVEFDHEAILGAPLCLHLFVWMLYDASAPAGYRNAQSLIRNAIAQQCAMSVKVALAVLVPVFIVVTYYCSIGSVKEAEEFDKLTPEESRAKLSLLLPKMDINGDKHLDPTELKKWILKSFQNLSREEAQERLKDSDTNNDQILTWAEYLQDTFGVDTDEELSAEDMGDSGMFEDELTSNFPPDHKLLGNDKKLVREERAMWNMADKNQDGALDFQEFEMFSNPEEHPEMHGFLVNQTLREKDVDRDGMIDFQEYVGERALHQDRDWLLTERERFETELDANKDGKLDVVEIRNWIIPNNDEIAEDEVHHLFAAADDDHDDLLSFDEILEHHDVFVGSEAADPDLLGQHFDDEL